MDYRKIPLNHVFSPIDERDYTIKTYNISVPTAFPDTFCLSYPGTVKNQGQVGSCVAHSLAYCRELIETIQKRPYKKFSVGFVYGNRLLTDNQEPGMIPSEALNHLVKEGDCLYDTFPINNEVPNIQTQLQNYNINNKLFNEAYTYRVSSYCRLNSVNEIKTALMNLGAVTVAYYIYDNFYNTNSNGVVPLPSGNILGGHEMTIIGWTKDNKWIVLNSWGAAWAYNGRCFIDFNYSPQEAYSITDTIVPTPPVYKKVYKVQVGAFKVKENADKLANDLRNKGIEVSIILINGLYKVQCGTFIDNANCQSMIQNLKGLGYNDVFITTIEQ